MAQASFKIEGTTPKFKYNNSFSANFSARALYDYYDFDADFGELTGSPSRDENKNDALFKRAIWTMDGKIGTKLKYKLEHQYEGDAKASWDDAYIEYYQPGLSIYIGSNHQVNSLDGQNSSAIIQFSNRSLITNAFAMSARNIGIAMRKYGKNWQLSAGIYGGSINLPMNRYFSSQRYFQMRTTYAPINNKNEILHFGASLRLRNRADEGLYSYSSRPIQMAIGTQFLQTGSISKSDTTIGGEIFYAKGPFSTQFEKQNLSARTLDGNLNFHGAYWENSYFLTGETRTYSVVRGISDYVKPIHPLGKGGYGAVSIVSRLDYLDLQDGNLGKISAPITNWRNRGGIEYGYSIGINWHPVERVIIRTSYANTKFKATRGQILQSSNLIDSPLGNGESKIFNIRTQMGF